MLRAAIAFFVLGLIAIALGATGVAGLSLEIGRTLLYVFLVLAVISFVASILTGKKTNINGFVWLAVLLAAGMVAGCTSMKNEKDVLLSKPSPAAETAARQAGAANVTEVNFAKGDFVLSEGAREAIKEMSERANAEGRVAEVKVLAWSDSDYPPNQDVKISKEEQELAAKRLRAIRDFVRDELAVRKIKTYNMAVRPNAFENMFQTSDAKTKNIFENAGLTTADGRSIGAKTSHAIVMEMVTN